jgi:hypothetical protein
MLVFSGTAHLGPSPAQLIECRWLYYISASQESSKLAAEPSAAAELAGGAERIPNLAVG